MSVELNRASPPAVAEGGWTHDCHVRLVVSPGQEAGVVRQRRGTHEGARPRIGCRLATVTSDLPICAHNAACAHSLNTGDAMK